LPLPGFVEPLTARELEVLALLATGRSNQQIADEPVMALAITKKRVSRVLGSMEGPADPPDPARCCGRAVAFCESVWFVA
jgi:Bacterial regulatory proteins, luxR family